MCTDQKGREGGGSYSKKDWIAQRALELQSKGLAFIHQSLTVLSWENCFTPSYHCFLSSRKREREKQPILTPEKQMLYTHFSSTSCREYDPLHFTDEDLEA